MSPLQRLSLILDILRKECPWDSAQTFDSLRYLSIEEVYELSDAIIALGEGYQSDTAGRSADVCRELGDLLMHVLFYCKIASDRGIFSFDDVCDAVSDKLVSRHPHISLPLADGTMRPVLTDSHPGWEQVKMREGRHSVLDGVPRSLPSLVQAVRLQEKAAGIGYDESSDGSGVKGQESMECAEELDATSAGDLLFALVGKMRLAGINADEALAHANRRFMQRVARFEEQCQDLS